MACNSLLTSISNNFNRYVFYLKQLSIMMLFYSRCDNNLDKMKADINNFVEDIQKEIKQAKIKQMENFESVSYINYN